MNGQTEGMPTTKGTAQIVYILYLVELVIGVTGIIGVVIAYLNRNDAPDWLKTHYQFQIRTFWIGLLYLFIGVLLTGTVILAIIGIPVLFFWVLWQVIRCVKGLRYLQRNEAHPNPTGWLFS